MASLEGKLAALKPPALIKAANASENGWPLLCRSVRKAAMAVSMYFWRVALS